MQAIYDEVYSDPPNFLAAVAPAPAKLICENHPGIKRAFKKEPVYQSARLTSKQTRV